MAIAEDRRRLTTRLAVLRVSTAAAFGLLACGFWFFQVVQHAKFKEMAENNHQRTLPLRAPRGIIFDRTGRLLVDNRNSFNISIVREHTKDIDRTIRVLAAVTGVAEKMVREIVDRQRREPSYRPIVIIPDATLAQVAAVTARRLDFELPDVLVQEVPTREYPDQAMAAHLIGYVGEASEEQVSADHLASGSIVGQFGIERVYNQLLMGEDGARRVVVNSVGREIRTLEEVKPVPGRRVQLAINSAMQKAAEEAFRAYGYWGSAVVLEPKGGDVLTLTSLPAFDPNDFATGIDRATWSQLNTDKLRPLQNRAIQGRYSPGSTFKVLLATAALEEGVITPEQQIFCAGVAPSMAASSSVLANTAGWTCGTPSRSHATPTSTPSVTCWASIASTSGASSWGSPARAASTCPTRSRASCPRRSGSACASTRSGTPVTPSPWRSARAWWT